MGVWLKRGAAFVWGLPQNLIGGSMALALRRCGRSQETFRLACVTRWKLSSGLSLGLFVFVGTYADQRLVVHEYGHCVQSILLGPLYLPLVVVPSLIWAGLPACSRYRKNRNVSYYAHPIEAWANRLGERLTHLPTPR
jgi:hypothetical protein